ncbi:thiamine pyrophosphate-dependent enzyme [Halothermothrix orenii]|uniref:Pyruvate ferredoxin oxidoreductase, beta subunit n=1 Tax=Halothermothrix orenii (strain H 168 / OCM 544 / DSM 9562) TaxID=373903 RepID=B8D260_HALOH|nr:thiamine pyrophosphate-dependent enzyme [Halothermothrix orenii]ACL69287.1 pyruvate ferredoxin oxidoreductase, beta subunit [Halothermothrix orenii H 168]
MIDNSRFYETKETAWCPGCGNFALRKSLVKALNELKLKPHQVVMFTGIGQAAKMPHYINVNTFNGLHGRSLPPAIGMRVANHTLTVIVESGDGCSYGEGGNHFIHNIRRNPDIIHLVHDNQIYGLTKGQASPTTGMGMKTRVQTDGVKSEPLNPLSMALGMGVGFVARGFVGEGDHLKELIKSAFDYKGYALIDILQPCVSFNKINTFKWYRERVYKLDENYDETDLELAFKKAREWEDRIPIGIIYRAEKVTFRERYGYLEDSPLVNEVGKPSEMSFLLDDFR